MVAITSAHPRSGSTRINLLIEIERADECGKLPDNWIVGTVLKDRPFPFVRWI